MKFRRWVVDTVLLRPLVSLLIIRLARVLGVDGTLLVTAELRAGLPAGPQRPEGSVKVSGFSDA
ncbi:hypothetical protein GCM10027360_21990 [Amycolatopsis echigonensis]